MKFRTQILTIVAITLLSVTASFANTAYVAAANALSAKLKKDLATSEISVKLSSVERYQVSAKVIGLRGRGEANDLTFDFDVKLTKGKFVPKAIEYNFVEPSFAPAAFEDEINEVLLKKINQDIKTTNIVLAIDFHNSESNGSSLVTSGYGEVSVNFQWKKIKFEIVKDETSNDVTSVKYQVF